MIILKWEIQYKRAEWTRVVVFRGLYPVLVNTVLRLCDNKVRNLAKHLLAFETGPNISV